MLNGLRYSLGYCLSLIMSADDVTARREARRRKILENSEVRLKRITGRNELGDCMVNEGNGSVNESTTTLTNGSVNLGEEGIGRFSSRNEPNLIPSVDFNSFTHSHDISNSEEVPESDHLDPLDVTTTSHTSELVYLYAAFLCRLLIELNAHYVCGNSMVVAFLIIKSGMVVVNGLPTSKTSRLLGSLLLFGGISTNKIKILMFIVSAVESSLKDFALYTFAFVFLEIFLKMIKYLFL